MRIINLTPHVIRVITSQGVVEFPSEGTARVSQTNKTLAPVHATGADGVVNAIPVARPEYGEVTGLPAPEEGTIVVVSTMIADAMRGSGRADIYVPDSGADAVREAGQVVAVRRLLWRGTTVAK